MKKIVISILLILTIFTNVFASGIYDKKKFYITEQNAKNASIRSMIYPGWGQFFLDGKTKGYMFSILFTLGIAGGTYFYYHSEDLYDEYEAEGLIDTDKYDDYVNNMNYSYYFFGLSVAVWIYNVVDAYLTGKDLEKKREDLFQQKTAGIIFDKNKILFCRRF